MRQIHDIKLDYNSTLGHEMQVRVHAAEAADGLEYIPAGKGFMIELVDELATNSIRHGERTHKLLDGAVIKVKQSYGVQVIDIYPPEEELEVKHYGLFSFKPRPDAPTAIIIESESENATDGIELYFDDRIQSGGIHTQDNTAYSEEVTEPVQLDDRTQRDNLYSIWMDARSTAGKNCASWSQGYMNRKYDTSDYQKIRQCDDFVDNKYLWYYGLTTRYAYVGGRLLYEAYYSDDVLGVGEVHGEEGSLLVYVLVNRYSKNIRLLTAPIPVVNYESHSEDPIHNLSDLTEVEPELIGIPDRRHPLSAFTFSGDGSKGVMSVFDWHDGSVITDYVVSFEVKKDAFGDVELTWELETTETAYVNENSVDYTAPVFSPTPGGGGWGPATTTMLPFNFVGNARYRLDSGFFGTPPQGCSADARCDYHDNTIIMTKHWCDGGPSAPQNMIDWVYGNANTGACQIYPDRIGYYPFANNCGVTSYDTHAIYVWWDPSCTKLGHETSGAVNGYGDCYHTSTYTPADRQTTPEIYASEKRTTKTANPMPFAQVMGPQGEIISATRGVNSTSKESGTSDSGYYGAGQSKTSISLAPNVCRSPTQAGMVVAALNAAYAHSYYSVFTSDSSYEASANSTITLKLPWRDVTTESSSSNSKRRDRYSAADSGYNTYIAVPRDSTRYGNCCHDIGVVAIPGDAESICSESSKATAKKTASEYIEGDLRYEMACTVDSESSSSSSGSGDCITGSSKASASNVSWYALEGEAIPGLDTYQKVTSTSSSKYSSSGGWMPNTSDSSSSSSSESDATFIHAKPLGLAFMAHPKGYGLVSLSDKRFVVDIDPEAADWKVTLQLYNKKTGAFTDILAMYNDALKPYNEYIIENGGEKIEELQSEINADDGPDKGKLNQMGEFFGVLSRIPRPQMRFEQ